ncbi:MAG: helix-turn-helix domain-containing protein [Promethearchaeota archaeon]
MNSYRAYKFRLYPSREQQYVLKKTFGCCRFLWNHMLHERSNIYQKLKFNKNRLNSYKYKTEKDYKAEFPFL